MRRFVDLLPVIFLMWVFFFLRVHDIDTRMPYFIDELNHINRSRIIYTFTDLHVSTTPGKFLLYYYLGLFDLPPNLPGWVARTAVVILALIGAAGTYALGKSLFTRRAGMIGLALLSVFPFMIFHERLTLSDPLTASLAVMMIWYSVVFARRPTMVRANVLGAMICVMLLGKILAGPLLAMPLLAIGLFGPARLNLQQPLWSQIQRAWYHYRPFLIRIALINAVIWGLIMTFYIGRGLVDPDNTNPIVDDYIFTPEDRASQLETNIDHFIEVFSDLWGPGLTILTLIAMPVLIWQRPRAAIFVLGGIGLLWVPIFVTAARPNSRYLTLVGHLWLVVVGGGITLLWSYARQLRSPLQRDGIVFGSIILLAWSLLFGASFSQTLIDDPTALDLPEAELNGYYRNFTGFAIRDALHYVAGQPQISKNADQNVILALTRACNFLPYHIPADLNVQIECIERLNKSVDTQQVFDTYGSVYVVWEQVDPPTRIADPRWINARLEWLATFERPHDGIEVKVYRAYPHQPVVGGVQQIVP